MNRSSMPKSEAFCFRTVRKDGGRLFGVCCRESGDDLGPVWFCFGILDWVGVDGRLIGSLFFSSSLWLLTWSRTRRRSHPYQCAPVSIWVGNPWGLRALHLVIVGYLFESYRKFLELRMMVSPLPGTYFSLGFCPFWGYMLESFEDEEILCLLVWRNCQFFGQTVVGWTKSANFLGPLETSLRSFTISFVSRPAVSICQCAQQTCRYSLILECNWCTS